MIFKWIYFKQNASTKQTKEATDCVVVPRTIRQCCRIICRITDAMPLRCPATIRSIPITIWAVWVTFDRNRSFRMTALWDRPNWYTVDTSGTFPMSDKLICFYWEQSNAVTSFLDHSNIYGSERNAAESVRLFSRGKLRLENDIMALTPNCTGPFCYFTGKPGGFYINSYLNLNKLYA